MKQNFVALRRVCSNNHTAFGLLDYLAGGAIAEAGRSRGDAGETLQELHHGVVTTRMENHSKTIPKLQPKDSNEG